MQNLLFDYLYLLNIAEDNNLSDGMNINGISELNNTD